MDRHPKPHILARLRLQGLDSNSSQALAVEPWFALPRGCARQGPARSVTS